VDPVRIGTLFDFDQGDGGRYFDGGLRLGLEAVDAEARLGRPIEIVPRQADGLPGGSAESVIAEVRAHVDDGALVLVGPSISDNGIVVRDLVDELRVPAVNYTGGAITRGHWMFHYQVGSLEEEPYVLVDHLRREGYGRMAVLHDDTPVGTNYRLWLGRAVTERGGPEIVHSAAVSPLADDLEPDVRRALDTGPDVVVYLGLGVAARAVALALDRCGWSGPAAANSALMFGYSRREWRAGWEGWPYVDTISDANPERARLRERSKAHAGGPIGVAAYDIGRLVGLALAMSDELEHSAVRDGLERVKRLPAASGHAGTTMGFGQQDHGALKGEFLVLRCWRDGRAVEVGSP
jgi:ABC-type branched-subunit amino acid transport system substrate-binding protein